MIKFIKKIFIRIYNLLNSHSDTINIYGNDLGNNLESKNTINTNQLLNKRGIKKDCIASSLRKISVEFESFQHKGKNERDTENRTGTQTTISW